MVNRQLGLEAVGFGGKVESGRPGVTFTGLLSTLKVLELDADTSCFLPHFQDIIPQSRPMYIHELDAYFKALVQLSLSHVAGFQPELVS